MPLRRTLLAALLVGLLPSIASANDKLTINQCMTVAKGLRALDRVGALIDEDTSRPARAGAEPKQYRLGALRFTIAANLAALAPVAESFERARNVLIQEISNGRPVAPGTPEMDRLVADLQVILDKPCEVAPGRIKLAELKLGDGPEENAIPPSVLAALVPIIDR